jgi:Bax protein
VWWWALPEGQENVRDVYPFAQELVMLDTSLNEEDQGIMVTVLPAPDFSGLGLSDGRKQQFIAWLLPLIGEENAKIAELRKKAVNLYGKTQSRRLSLTEKEWLMNLATDYEVDVSDNTNFNHVGFWQGLLHRLDMIPPSLVLTQAALESGWGTSRIAKAGHNYFGIMCFKAGCGIQSDTSKGEFRRFDSAKASVSGYMRIINTKGAYRSARSVRMQSRLLGLAPSGEAMAKTLLNYSELGRRYVSFLMKIMHDNHFEDYDGLDTLVTVETVKSGQK